MRVTRKEILKAIRTENLGTGKFIEGIDVGYVTRVIVYDDSCKVCAVGAVLRQAGTPSDRIMEVANEVTNKYEYVTPQKGLEGHEFTAMKRRAWLNALSIRFEELALKTGTGKETRDALCRFVKRHFPKTINVKTR